MPKEKGVEQIHISMINEKDKNQALAQLKCITHEKVYSDGMIHIRGHLARDYINIKSREKVPTNIKNTITEENTERMKQDTGTMKRNKKRQIISY